MTLGEKIRYLREVEGSLRGLNRPLTQQELMKGIRSETGKTISQSYLSQIEGGKRPHMTQSSRTVLARFFKVHPGFLVDDPEGYHTELVSDLRTTEGQLDVWLLQGSEHVTELFQECAALSSDSETIPRALPRRPDVLRQYLEYAVAENRMEEAGAVAARVLAEADEQSTGALLRYCDRLLGVGRAGERLAI